jgi:type III pantothenate kinase
MNIILAIDAGNTRIKWGLHDGQRWLAQDSVRHPEVAGLAVAWQGAHISSAIISSVAGSAVNQSLQQLLDELAVPATWLKSSAAAGGVSNGYADPAQLGTDRWAAVVAAWQRYHQPCVVVSAGTALTIDALSSAGEFLGGVIAPGLTMMQSALVNNTAALEHGPGQLQDFPAATADAMFTGALLAMAGAVLAMQNTLQQREQTAPRLILTGGDANALQVALSGQGEIVDNLVLEGLIVLKDCT